MKKHNKKNKYLLSNKQIRFFKKLSIIVIIFFFVISLLWYYKLNLYFTDKYDWYVYLGFKYLNKGTVNKALGQTNKALNLDKDRPEAYRLRAIIFTVLEKYHLAERELETLKDKDKKYQYYYYWRMGRMKLEQGMVNESMKYFRKGIEERDVEKNPFISHNYFGIGLIYLKNNDSENAFKYFNQSKLYLDSSLDKEFMEGFVHAGLGFTYQKKGEYEKANEELEKAESFKQGAVKIVRKIIS